MYGYGYQYSAIISGGGNPAAAIFSAYKSRVLADSGVVENDACTITFLESIGAGIIPSFSFLLDAYSGAAAAYSLRKLRNAYSGDAIRVRRASDNAELNIGFVDNVLDTSTLTTFASGSDAFVTTWYDQSGSGYNAVQTTASNQPKIVSSGSVLTLNSKPCINFDGIDDLFSSPYQVNVTANYANFYVLSSNNTATKYILACAITTSNRYAMGVNDIGNFQHSKRTAFISGSSISYSAGQVLLSDNNVTEIYKNNIIGGVASTLNNAFSAAPYTYIGQNLAAGNNLMSLQEIVMYAIDQSANRAGINTNVNDYYATY